MVSDRCMNQPMHCGVWHPASLIVPEASGVAWPEMLDAYPVTEKRQSFSAFLLRFMDYNTT